MRLRISRDGTPRTSSIGPHRCGSLATSVDEPVEGRSA
jgi:hypothetical protein